MAAECTHKDQIKGVEPKTPKGCEECIKQGAPWVSLRMCLTCGHVGCCDNSMYKHATAHFKETDHAIMKSLEATRPFTWCFIDEVMVSE